ncbi:Asp-tRNA(Asn)/Glu-tRNA(Gln) amidotransferase GatCAB subunit C [Sporosarcina sp. BI001-red]|uniref:Asp-tRNA(Asn)/Glu-tRNA(Gln) amidotransferase subunit GatC n=1 Tax=Sporosarcina sp. BI001-red TaxID=2282866 RepID=UPI000E2585C7|nr:Asp-tRNA(Asn)/Glu-tRNA(Gln) amidotransferase subunit GatC [Sporosarcina sp. BI001-red]REB11136.1 Asp-tRNA(Asn)/Glu-tRNA(Gln) amidotransferase GatCAB subunit C [Sporosarcina sp. BI001-red]
MSNFTKEDIQYYANFARIDMPDAEAEKFATRLDTLLEFSDRLKELDTTDVEPMTHPLAIVNVLREDTPEDILDREEMLKSVEDHEDGLIKVPNILD